MSKLLLFLLPITWAFTSCTNYGKKLAFGKCEVYYKGEGVTEADAKKLGDYLTQQKYFNDSAASSVQLTKQSDSYVIKFVVDKEKVEQDKKVITNEFWLMQNQIATNVFNGAKTKIILTDPQFKDIEPMDNLTMVTEGNFQIYLKGNSVTEAQAKKLASILQEQKYFGDAKEAIQMGKENGSYVLNFVYNQNYYQNNKETLSTVFKMIQWLASEEVFNNAKTQVNLAEPYFKVF
jgi:hypothetical protein